MELHSIIINIFYAFNDIYEDDEEEIEFCSNYQISKWIEQIKQKCLDLIT